MVINYDLCFLLSNRCNGGHAKARPYGCRASFKDNWDNNEQQFIKKENNKYKKYNGVYAL